MISILPQSDFNEPTHSVRNNVYHRFIFQSYHSLILTAKIRCIRENLNAISILPQSDFNFVQKNSFSRSCCISILPQSDFNKTTNKKRSWDMCIFQSYHSLILTNYRRVPTREQNLAISILPQSDFNSNINLSQKVL